MKWNKELDDKLKNLINLKKDYNEIAKEFNVSYRTLTNRAFRLGLKILKQHNETILCKNCGKIINKTLCDKREFCNSSCSAQYNNKKRKHTEETKNKIRDKNLGKTYPSRRKEKIFIEHKIKKQRNYCKIKKYSKNTTKINFVEIKLRKCRFCGEQKLIHKHKIICEECGIKYYKIYRPLCEFDFNIYDYKNEFELSLINEYGWYSPTNKRNNLNGISKDHIYSVKDGFINKIDYKIIKHPANCQLLKHVDNNKKKCQSLITLDELLLKIKKWDEKFVPVVQ